MSEVHRFARLLRDARPSLRTESRFDTTPEELTLKPDRDGYETCGDEETLRSECECRQVQKALGDQPQTSAEIVEVIELPAATVRRYLADLLDDGSITMPRPTVSAKPS